MYMTPPDAVARLCLKEHSCTSVKVATAPNWTAPNWALFSEKDTSLASRNGRPPLVTSPRRYTCDPAHTHVE